MSNHKMRRELADLQETLADVRVTARMYHEQLKLAEQSIRELSARWERVWYRRAWNWICRR